MRYNANLKLVRRNFIYLPHQILPMEDLLKETDFKTELPDYSHKKYFRICYLCVFILEMLFFVLLGFGLKLKSILLGVLIIFLPILCALLIYLLRAKNRQLPFRRLFSAIAVLYSVYYFPAMLGITFFNDPDIAEIGYMIAIVLGQYLISMGIIALLHFKGRKSKNIE